MHLEQRSDSDRSVPPPGHGGKHLGEPHSVQRARPLISVVTVVYNAAEQLRLTIESVLRQDLEDIEYIIVDGGSSDGTLAVLHEFNKRLTYWVSERDSGIYNAMNKALAVCTGEYVHFLNAGDRYASADALRRVSLLLRLRPALLMNRVKGRQHNDAVTLLPKTIGLDTCRRLFDSAYCHQGAFVLTSLLQTIGFDDSYRYFADFHALMRIRRMTSAVLETSEVIVDFPLDGVSSDWRKAPILYVEKERLLATLGEGRTRWRYWFGFLRAHLYRLKMAVKSR